MPWMFTAVSPENPEPLLLAGGYDTVEVAFTERAAALGATQTLTLDALSIE